MVGSELVRLLVEERQQIIPLVGAGLGVEAGLPTSAALAGLLAERSAIDSSDSTNFGTVCREIAEAQGLKALQSLAAGAIGAIEVRPTSSTMAVSGCPSQRILTTNYDMAIEKAVEEIGKTPVRISLSDPMVGRTPAENEVFVIHLHGVTEHPEQMILTTSQRQALVEDQGFRMQLRALLLGGRALTLGLRLSVEEVHLRAEFGWLKTVFEGRPPLVLVPKDEVDEGLRLLAADRVIELCPCDQGQNYLEARQYAQVLAARQVDPTTTVTKRAPALPTVFLEPPLLGPKHLEDGSKNDPSTTVFLAESEIGGPLATLSELVEAQRALLVGAPGRGKSVALRKLGEELAGRAILCDLRNLRPDVEDPARGFAQLVADDGLAFDDETQRPNIEALRERSYVFLLDGLDETKLQDRAPVVEAITAAASSFPQHSYVVATRPTIEAQRIVDAGFKEFLIEASESWGRGYLLASGITTEQIEHLYEVAPSIGPQLAIPRYAARICDSLRDATEGAEIPTGALELLLRGESKNLENSANRLAVELDALLEWARRAAVLLELRGETSIPVEEILSIPGPQGRESGDAYRELVDSALLQDLPDEVRFSASVSQEALCADAVLRSSDPLAVLKEAAIAEIGEEPVFRDDIEHTLDLIFEGASRKLREELREFDPLRWARTVNPAAPDTDAELEAEAIEAIWEWYRQRKLWIPFRGEGGLRSPSEALEVLHKANPEYLESRRSDLYADCENEERTIRGNAVELLTLLPADERTEEVLGTLLKDEDDVVRRHAAHAVEHFELAGMRDALLQAWDAEHDDELAFEAIGLALAALSSYEELVDALPSLTAQQIGWRRISHRVLTEVDLPTTADSIAGGGPLSFSDAEEVIDKKFASDEDWGGAEVEALSRLLVIGGPRYFGHKHNSEIVELVGRFPDAALAGARKAATEETRFLDLLWLSDLDPGYLREHANGPLAEPIEKLLERIDLRRAAEANPDSDLDLDVGQENDGEEEPPKDVATLLVRGQVDESKVAPEPLLWQLSREAKEVKEEILALAESWYPESAKDAVVRDGSRYTVNRGFRAAIVTWAALNEPIEKERWLDVMSSGISTFDSRISDWLASAWNKEWLKEATERVAGLADPWTLSLAAKAIESWDQELCVLFAAKLCEHDDETLAHVIVGKLSESGASRELRQIADSQCSEEVREIALEALAGVGDVDAQREKLEQILSVVEKQPAAYEHRPPSWLSSISASGLLDLLFRILAATHRCEDASMFRRVIEAAIRNLSDPRGLALYDEMIEDESFEGGAFYWYQREALARSLARQDVMQRLSGHEPLAIVFDALPRQVGDA